MQEGERQRFGKSTRWIGDLIPKVLFWDEKLGQSDVRAEQVTHSLNQRTSVIPK